VVKVTLETFTGSVDSGSHPVKTKAAQAIAARAENNKFFFILDMFYFDCSGKGIIFFEIRKVFFTEPPKGSLNRRARTSSRGMYVIISLNHGAPTGDL
jgi:hypothetical protein